MILETGNRQLETPAAERPIAPPPHPYARKKPNITLEQLEALNNAVSHRAGVVEAANGVKRALINRGLAERASVNASSFVFITDAGRLLIRTQYAALKAVLLERKK